MGESTRTSKSNESADAMKVNNLLMEEEEIPNIPEQAYDHQQSEQLLYNVSDIPPIHMSFFFAIQQTFLAISTSLVVSSFVADVGCASDFPDLKTNLLSSTFFMNGITTLLMVTLGVRLPVFQGATTAYIVPLLAIKQTDTNFCTPSETTLQHLLTQNRTFEENRNLLNVGLNESHLDTDGYRREIAITRLREFQGSLIAAGVFHCLVGATGAVGFLMKFIGPVTIVPTMLVMSVFLAKSTGKMAKTHWGISSITAVTSIILSVYLSQKKMPCPVWSRKLGFHIYWYPLHRVFAILIGIIIGWLLSAILTHAGVLTDDPNVAEFYARTDARAGIIQQTNLFRVPYPNQFGSPSFQVTVFVSFLIGSIMSILDSIGDYNACARICNVPPPPAHAVNRGIAVEGFCSTLSGVIGCGHATSTYGGNIGAIGLTKVASRSVFLWAAGIYILFGIVGKVSAIFITIPYPVLGGAMIVLFGMFNGIVLSNLETVSLKSSRNLAIIGISFLVGIMVPSWLEKNPGDINKENLYYASMMKHLLANPNLCCGIVACLMDNTVPGTAEERGILAWLQPGKQTSSVRYNEGQEVYIPLLPTKVLSLPIMKYIPFIPFQPRKADDERDDNIL